MSTVRDHLRALTGREPLRAAGWPLPYTVAAAWAVHPIRAGGRAHFWKRGPMHEDVIVGTTLCGLGRAAEHRGVTLLAEGDWGRCSLCLQAIATRRRHGLWPIRNTYSSQLPARPAR